MAKQGDSDAHDAYCQLTGSDAVTERRLLGWGRGEGKSVVAKHWRTLLEMHGPVQSSPPAESGFASKETS